MPQFALELDVAESNCTPDGLTELFGSTFRRNLRYVKKKRINLQLRKETGSFIQSIYSNSIN